ncbi:MAG: GntR family transcriptional regulator [Anaerolineae bacterium]|nr:GntR family transcriptional regulator [Anaerolineae bacterium]
MLTSASSPNGNSSLLVAPITRVNIRDDVYVLLRSNILNHAYPPGHRLDLDELSNQLKVSRTPVKEALHKLETEGLIQILPRKGTFVTPIDPKSVSEGYDVRLALEVYIAPAVIANITATDLAQLEELRHQMQMALQERNFKIALEQYTALDQAFHVLIVSAGGNERLTEIYRTVGGPLQMARLYYKFDAEVYRNFTEPEHNAIMAALTQRDIAALQSAVIQHIQRAKTRVLNLNSAQ